MIRVESSDRMSKNSKFLKLKVESNCEIESTSDSDSSTDA